MEIIPVIDLKNGVVVHAKQGNREQYAPLKSGLCDSSGLFDVIRAYITLFNFPTIYIADLDAITCQGDNADLLAQALAAFPDIRFWVDGGYPLCNDNLQQFHNFLPVLGSESFTDATAFEISTFKKNFILSLDHSSTGEMGAKALFSSPQWWPEQIIIMSLPKVGSNSGPDWEKLKTYKARFPQHTFIAAGGIRHCADLEALGTLGISHALLATALHNGSISPSDIARLLTKKYPG